MVGTQRESGLSEVVGFILIIAILVVVASLYVTYVVPAQGREAEIAHMTYIKNQFVDFKMAMDSLWIHSLVNTSLSQNIEMGTSGQKTQGQFTVIPIAQPIGSSGVMKVSNDPEEGTINITLDAFVKDAPIDTLTGTSSTRVEVNPDIYTQLLTYQSMYPATISNMIIIPPLRPVTDAPLDPNDFGSSQVLSFPLLTVYPNSTDPAHLESANWTATFNLTRVPSFYVPSWAASVFSTDNRGAKYMNATFRYDLIMSLVKRNQSVGYPVFQNFTLNSSDQLPGPIWVNLQDPAYGLDASGPLVAKNSTNTFYGYENISRNWDLYASNNLFSPMNISPVEVENTIKAGYTFSPVSSGVTAMGKFTYKGQNFYWVPQDYYYQMGGVFLNQTGSVSKLLPLISLGMTTDASGARIPSISITKMVINRQNMTIGGSSPVLVSSSISKIWRGIVQDSTGNAKYIAPIKANGGNISIIIGPSTLPNMTRQLWSDTFNATIRSASQTSEFNPSWVNLTNAPNVGILFQMGSKYGTSCPANISIDYSEVNASVVLQPVGWQGA